jgi:Lrp/AsnC family transcriptional regulator for asnA, asnC and gidA
LRRYFIGFDVDPAGIDIVMGALVAMPETSYVQEMAGPFNVVVIAFFSDADQLLPFLSKRVGRLPGIRKTEVIYMTTVLKKTRRWEIEGADASHLYPRERAAVAHDRVPRIDATDRALMRELQANGRLSNVALGDMVGLSEAAVRRRLERLQVVGTIRVAAILDPRVLGLNVEVFIGFEVDQEHLDQVGQALAALTELRYVYAGVNRLKFIGIAYFSNEEDFQAFVQEKLSRVPGVKKTEVWRLVRTVKQAERWEAPVDDDAVSRPQPSRGADARCC